MDVVMGSVVIDCEDPIALARFWSAVMGYEILEPPSERWANLRHPTSGVEMGFQRVPEPKVVKNRVHIDLYAADEVAAAEHIEALGARRLWVSDDPDDVFIVLADPECNEFCVVRESE